MNETTMPAAEVNIEGNEVDLASYEFAFHILPTVAEGEVTAVTEELKSLITKAGGEIFDVEAAERFELAYEIDKYLEGKYRKFTSAYFGWVRFTLAPQALASLTESIDEHKQLLRYLLVRLTKVEEANPFRFHEALESSPIRTINTDVVEDETGIVEGEVVDAEGVVDEVIVEEVKVA
jgi:ribosomal protein S6